MKKLLLSLTCLVATAASAQTSTLVGNDKLEWDACMKDEWFVQTTPQRCEDAVKRGSDYIAVVKKVRERRLNRQGVWGVLSENTSGPARAAAPAVGSNNEARANTSSPSALPPDESASTNSRGSNSAIAAAPVIGSNSAVHASTGSPNRDVLGANALNKKAGPSSFTGPAGVVAGGGGGASPTGTAQAPSGVCRPNPLLLNKFIRQDRDSGSSPILMLEQIAGSISRGYDTKEGLIQQRDKYREMNGPELKRSAEVGNKDDYDKVIFNDAIVELYECNLAIGAYRASSGPGSTPTPRRPVARETGCGTEETRRLGMTGGKSPHCWAK